MASLTDDNAEDRNSGKSNVKLIKVDCTRAELHRVKGKNMNKKYKKNIAGLLAAIMVLSQAIPAVASQETGTNDGSVSESAVETAIADPTPGDSTFGDPTPGDVSSGNNVIVGEWTTKNTLEGEKNTYVTNSEGLWITEIYQDDINRSIRDTATARKGYDGVDDLIYDMAEGFSAIELMEFIEFTSTYTEPINFNEMYQLTYNGKAITGITDMNNNSDITIQPGQTVVFWNRRADYAKVPNISEEEFRAALRIPDDTLILKRDGNWEAPWDATATFALKTKDGETISTFKVTNMVETTDGFSVELKVPAIGSEMLVYRTLAKPSPGTISLGQVRGLIPTKENETEFKGVYITEVRINDKDRSNQFDVSATGDLMDCIEIVNTTDHDVDLNVDYQLEYSGKESYYKQLRLYHYDPSSATNIGNAKNCIVPAGGTAVIWMGITSFIKAGSPTEDDFRAAYGISDDVPVYLATKIGAFPNTKNGVELYKIEDDGSKTLVSNYHWISATEDSSAILWVNPLGPEMLIYSDAGTSTIGTVAEKQYTWNDDGSSMTLKLYNGTTVPDAVMQGEELRVAFTCKTDSTYLPSSGTTTYYRFDGEGEWQNQTLSYKRVPDVYEFIMTANELYEHDYIEFFVCADNRLRSTISELYTVKIKKLNDVDGIRTNITDGENISGTVSFTATDGKENDNITIAIDGNKYAVTPMLEDGGYLSFTATGRDNTYRSYLTTTGGEGKEIEYIDNIAYWYYVHLDDQMIHIDNRYFTYNSATNSYDTTLRFWSGTYFAADDKLRPDEDRDEFEITNLLMKLGNGNEYAPTAIADDGNTNAKTNFSIDPSAVHAVGDADGYSEYLDVSFSIPAAEVTAVGAEINTKALSDGEHILTVSNGTSTGEVRFIVDNTAPVIDPGIEDGADLTGNITLNPQITEANAYEVAYVLDGEEIEAPYVTTAYELGEGEHTLTVWAKDGAGNTAEKAVTFTIGKVSISVTDGGTTDITDNSASLYLSVDNTASDAQAIFYRAEKIGTAYITTNTTGGILPYIQYTVNAGDVSKEDVIVVSWDGEASNSDDTHASTMYVLNTETDKWDVIGKADANGSIKEASFAAGNYVKDGKATIIVQCTADSSLPDLETETDGKLGTNADWDGESAPVDYDFCFAWETDTQYYVSSMQYHNLQMNQWIVDNAEAMKIKYVIHTGDLVDDYDMIYQWENADEALKILDEAGMPYGVLAGNHDVAAGVGATENYQTYFGEDRFVSQETYGGSYQNNLGHYDLISENGQDFILVYMSWNVYKEEINWVNEVLAQYSDRKAILLFHPYTYVKKNNDSFLDTFGKLLQEEVVAKNANVFAVLNGHYHGSVYETAEFDDDGDGVNDRTVYQICTDYQAAPGGGNEYIKFLFFDLDNNKIYMNSYSPYLDDWNYFETDSVAIAKDDVATGNIDKMILDVEFNTDEQSILEKQFSAYVYTNEELGTAEVDRATGKATADLTNLKAETDYMWYAVVTNANTGYLRTDAYEFTTLKKTVTEETPEESGTTEETDSTEESGSTEEPGTTEGTGSTEESGTTEETESTEESGSTDGDDSMDESASADDSEAADNAGSDSQAVATGAETGDQFPMASVVVLIVALGILGGLAVYRKRADSVHKE